MKLGKYLAAIAFVGMLGSGAASAQTQSPKMKMTTPIPPSITTPDSVDTSIGTLKFFDEIGRAHV